MSLSYITSLMQKDTSLRYSNIVQWAQHLNRTVIITHIESTLPFGDELPGIAHIGMLLVNTKGQFAWVDSFVNPEKKIPAVLSRKLNVTSEILSNSKSWKDGWLDGFSKMAGSSTVVSLQDFKHDFRSIEKQYVRYGGALNWLQQLSLKDEFLKLHPNRSGTTADLLQFYQLAQSGDYSAKERLLLAVNLLDIMLGETGVSQFGQSGVVDSTSTVKEDTNIDTEILPEDRNLAVIEKLSSTKIVENTPLPEEDPEWAEKLSSARAYLLQEASFSRDPVDYFSRIEARYPLRITPGNKRINGYSLNVAGHWLRASEISPDLGWNQLLENQAWPFSVTQISSLSRWFYSGS